MLKREACSSEKCSSEAKHVSDMGRHMSPRTQEGKLRGIPPATLCSIPCGSGKDKSKDTKCLSSLTRINEHWQVAECIPCLHQLHKGYTMWIYVASLQRKEQTCRMSTTRIYLVLVSFKPRDDRSEQLDQRHKLAYPA